MKVVILAGGKGKRISEYSKSIPKPMIEIGGKPLLWHIMKIYHTYGYSDFIICGGYRSEVIKEYFSKYNLYNSDLTFDYSCGRTDVIVQKSGVEPWRVTIVNTGTDVMTGGRIKRILPYIEEENFLLTYGDGVGNVDISKLVKFHCEHGKMATITAVTRPEQYGVVEVANNEVVAFREKEQGKAEWINAGFMVMKRDIIDTIAGDDVILEKDTLVNLVQQQQLMAYVHTGFWKSMDTVHDKELLEQLWKSTAPWRVWDE